MAWDTKDSKTSIRRNAIGARCKSGGCVKDRRDAVLFAVQKRGKYGGRIELKWREKRQGFVSRGFKFEDKDCKVGKEGELSGENVAARMGSNANSRVPL